MIKQFLNKGNIRSVRVKKNILASIIIKGISIIVSLLYVPLLIDYLDIERYGIWLTLTSIVGWFTFFDAGLGNGLRNNLSEAFANNNIKLAKELISTTYALLSIIFTVVLIIYYAISPFLDWQLILNSENVSSSELSYLAIIIFTFFFLRFIFQLIGVIIMAKQQPALNNLFGPLGNLISLILIYILTLTTKGNLIVLGSIISIIPVIVLLVASILLFNKKYKEISPSIKHINWKHSNKLLNLGFKFFFLQISSIILFSLSNIIIIQYLKPEDVTQYNIAFKYFQIPLMIYAIIITPIWSAVTEAFVKKDINWLKSTLKKLNIISLVFILIIIIMSFFSEFMYDIWLGNRVEIPILLSLSMGLFSIVRIILSPYSSYINGIGKLALSIRLSVFKIIFFIPCAILLVQTDLGASGVVFATIIFNSINIPFFYLQVKKLINGNAVGIFNR